MTRPAGGALRHGSVAVTALASLVAVLSAGCGAGTDTAGPAPSRSVVDSPSGTPEPTRASPAPTTPASTAPTPTRPAPTTAAPTRTATPGPTATALPAPLAGHVIWRIPTTRRVVALTFDGGSGSQGAASVLSTLSSAGVPASFFLTGRFADSNPATVARIGAGYVIGSHTMTHPHLTQLSAAAARAEVSTGAAAVRAVVGRSTAPWFRFPFGEYDGRTLAIVNDMGQAGIGWTIDTLGWEGRSGAGSVGDIVARVTGKLQPGAIVLMHLGAAPDGSTLDADALPRLIAAIRAAGYGFVDLRALL